MPTVTVNRRIFASGETVVSRNVPAGTRFSQFTLDVDIGSWTSSATQSVAIFIEKSDDGGATWGGLASTFTEFNAPWLNRQGVPDPHIHIGPVEFKEAGVPLQRNVDQFRIRVIVTGSPVSLSATIDVA